MPHIPLPEGLPGITSAFAYRPETAKPMRELAEVLLRGPNTLTSGEREMIAAFVSRGNDCHFCQASHRAAAAHHLDGNYALVDAVKGDYQTAPVSAKLKALLTIAGKVQRAASSVTDRRRRARARRRRDRHRNPRHRADRRGVLHVQPLRRRPRDLHADRPRRLRPDGPAHGEAKAMFAQTPELRSLYLPGVEAEPQPGTYRDLIDAAQARRAEYRKIWDLFAFQRLHRPPGALHAGRDAPAGDDQPRAPRADRRLHVLPERVPLLHQGARGGRGASCSATQRWCGRRCATSSTRRSTRRTRRCSASSARSRQNLPAVDADDIAALHAAGWDDEAIYFAITTCALFNFYNRWITATGVPEMSAGRRTASRARPWLRAATSATETDRHGAHHPPRRTCPASAGRWRSGRRRPSRSTSSSTSCCAGRTR